MNLNAFDPYASKRSLNNNNNNPNATNTSTSTHTNTTNNNNANINDPKYARIQTFLRGQRFPSALRRTLLEAHQKHQRYIETQQAQTQNHQSASPPPPPNLIWIVDNSVHMTVADS